MIQKGEYVRSETYLRTVRGRPCLICGRPEASAHHLMFAQDRGMSLKTGDQWAVPLCHACHMKLHRYGDERTWWDLQGVDPAEWAKANWEKFNGTNRCGDGLHDRHDPERG